MTKAGRKPADRARALLAAVAFLLSWAAAPAALAAARPSACSMTCCVEAGYCCCGSDLPFVQNQHEGDVQVAALHVATRCPDGCATPQSSANHLARLAPQAPTHALRIAEGAALHLHAPPRVASALLAASAAPRAPPRALPS